MTSQNDSKLLQELVRIFKLFRSRALTLLRQDSFHTLLDEALIVAIAGDFELKDPSAYARARSTLEDLAQSVPSEEVSGFNPSGLMFDAEEGTGHQNAHLDRLDHVDTSTTCASHTTSQVYATDKSSTDASSHVPDSPRLALRLTSFNQDSEEDKVLVLQSMFAELKPYDVSYALKKADGDFQIALDDLLNIQYLQSTGQQLKGVDGFFVTESKAGKRKRKKKGDKKVASSDSDLSGSTSVSNETSATENGQDEVQYIADRFGVRSDEVTPIYRNCEGSQGATVVKLLEQYISHGVETQDQAGKETSDTLIKKYRHVPPEFMPTIVHVSGSIPQFAEDIAALLNKHFSKPTKAKKIDLAYRLTPLPQGEIEGSQYLSPGAANAARTGPACTSSTSLNVKSVAEALGRADTYHQARRDAASSAVQLHRRGASSPLYRQAAGYYADRAREQARYAQSATSTAADLLVDEQSTRRSIDLHGVLVHDGVRIARQKVQDWWQGLGEMRAKKAREQGGFTVITGLGRHSAGGVSQLRQCVAAALLQDGWKVSVETGKFVVLGRR
ncbi:hypothetical protein E4U19_001616 [Claviceps sp. Clav32 group G5]|nr:hypothetical protein E4U19_001616 [Claviceps sp. Clav32 group G5]KAG6035115.1 hypothetical protein E4U40_002949 [Claviceps sp. LM458 group G5]